VLLTSQQSIRHKIGHLNEIRARRLLEDRVFYNSVGGQILCLQGAGTNVDRDRVVDAHFPNKPRNFSILSLIADKNRVAIPCFHRFMDARYQSFESPFWSTGATRGKHVYALHPSSSKNALWNI
jgi:hypothetical protein